MTTQSLRKLQEPFPISAHEFRLAGVSGDHGVAVTYVDSRHYMTRLDEVSPDWYHELTVQHLPGRVVVHVRLYAVGKHVDGLGEAPDDDPNAVTSAEAQAFRRACTALGLGRYLYHLPRWRVRVEKRGNATVLPAEEVQRLRRELAAYLRRSQRADEQPAAQPAEPEPAEDASPEAYGRALARWAKALGARGVRVPRNSRELRGLEAYVLRRLAERGVEVEWDPGAPMAQRMAIIAEALEGTNGGA